MEEKRIRMHYLHLKILHFSTVAFSNNFQYGLLKLYLKNRKYSKCSIHNYFSIPNNGIWNSKNTLNRRTCSIYFRIFFKTDDNYVFEKIIISVSIIKKENEKLFLSSQAGTQSTEPHQPGLKTGSKVQIVVILQH